MTPDETIAFLKDAITHKQYEVDSLTTALTLLENGYQSDQAYITAQVKASVDDAVAQATAPLEAQLAEAQPAVTP